MSDRYQAESLEVAFEPGSDGKVLANRLGIIDPDAIDDVELRSLAALYEAVLIGDLPQRTLHLDDLHDWHRRWLSPVYAWAGELRSVNVSNDGFLFAAAEQVPRLLTEFERDCLHRYTPCTALEGEALAEAIAVTHVELILIHPFREGNGRLARLLADVMAVQAGLLSLDYSGWDAGREAYFAAIRAGQGRDYEPMIGLVNRALRD
jgi:cell filamentation protein